MTQWGGVTFKVLLQRALFMKKIHNYIDILIINCLSYDVLNIKKIINY